MRLAAKFSGRPRSHCDWLRELVAVREVVAIGCEN